MSLKSQRTLNILLVEDSPSDIRLTQEALRHCTVPVHLEVVRDGEAALVYLSQQFPYSGAVRPDLILLDLNLPKKSGRQVLQAIKENPDLRMIPVLVLSTSGNPNEVLMAYQLHANSYIQKPVDLNQFLRVMGAFENFWLHLAVFPPLAAEADVF